MTLEEGVPARLAAGPFAGAAVRVLPASALPTAAAAQLMARVRFVTMPEDLVVAISANLSPGVERCVTVSRPTYGTPHPVPSKDSTVFLLLVLP